MRLLFRADSGPQIGAGHVMRSLALADAARAQGHDCAFVTSGGALGGADLAAAAGHRVFALPDIDGNTPAAERPSDPDAPPHAHWLSLPWQADADVTAKAVGAFKPDWLIWDHYGLDARWVRSATAGHPDLRVLAIDDLDDRALASDLVLDQTRIDPGPRRHRTSARLTGPDYALLRPEFAAARDRALARRASPGRHILLAPGFSDPAGLAPRALEALALLDDVTVTVAMSSKAASRARVDAFAAARPWVTCAYDSADMARLMIAADLCIGAGGMTSWERCTLGLPTLVVPVADNQAHAVRDLVEAGAAQSLPMSDTSDAETFARAIEQALASLPDMSKAAAGLCDGQGTAHVLGALSGQMRPLTPQDARLLFDWRNQPHIRAASLNPDPLDWEAHQRWVAQVSARADGQWLIYSEADRPLGHINAVDRGAGRWHWSFYIGSEDAPKGAGSRMCALFLRQMFRNPAVKQITADVLPGNPASRALHEALGFRRTGEGTGPDTEPDTEPDREPDKRPDTGQDAGPVTGGALAFALRRCDLDAEPFS